MKCSRQFPCSGVKKNPPLSVSGHADKNHLLGLAPKRRRFVERIELESVTPPYPQHVHVRDRAVQRLIRRRANIWTLLVMLMPQAITQIDHMLDG